MSERNNKSLLTPSTQVGGLTAHELFAKSDRSLIHEIVREQVKLIDAEIITAHTAGFNHIEHELPINFNINNMNKSDAQTMIYSELLMIYKNPIPEGKGFNKVYIDGGLKSKLHIYWLNGMNAAERKRRNQFISECQLPRGDKN